MTPLVALAVLIAAITHASWNAIAHAIKDQLLSFTLISGGGLLIGAALALFAPLPAAGAWPYLLVSAALHVLETVTYLAHFIERHETDIRSEEAKRKISELVDRSDVERIALNDEYFIEKKLYPNIDFYSGITLKALGFPTDMFTVLFAIARTVGWIAQWKEMIEDPSQRIGRPRQLYTGPTERSYVPIDAR